MTVFDPKPFCDNNGALQVLLVHKKSRLELEKQELSAAKGDIADQHRHHMQCLDTVRQSLRAHKAVVEDCFRDDISKSRTKGRLVITVGGDGTVLDASHASEGSPVLGINSDPIRSVGSLCVGSNENFPTLLNDLLAGKLEYRSLARVRGELNGKPLKNLALNEILIAHQNPAGMSRYQIRIGDQVEEQKSSGIWIATSTGSTGAILSAGGHIQDLDDDRLQYVVREPYLAVGKVGRLFSGICEASIEVTSMMVDGRIFIDGPMRTETFTTGSKLVISAEKTSLSLFVSEELELRRRQIARLRESIHG